MKPRRTGAARSAAGWAAAGMRRAARPLAVVLVVLAAVATLAACGRAPFVAGSVPNVPSVITRAGTAVLAQGTAKNYYPGGQEAHWYVVGRQGTDKPAAVVSVLTFDSQRARDAAAMQMENILRAGPRVDGLFTMGNAVIRVYRITDKGVARALDAAMREAGMK